MAAGFSLTTIEVVTDSYSRPLDEFISELLILKYKNRIQLWDSSKTYVTKRDVLTQSVSTIQVTFTEKEHTIFLCFPHLMKIYFKGVKGDNLLIYMDSDQLKVSNKPKPKPKAKGKGKGKARQGN